MPPPVPAGLGWGEVDLSLPPACPCPRSCLARAPGWPSPSACPGGAATLDLSMTVCWPICHALVVTQ